MPSTPLPSIFVFPYFLGPSSENAGGQSNYQTSSWNSRAIPVLSRLLLAHVTNNLLERGTEPGLYVMAVASSISTIYASKWPSPLWHSHHRHLLFDVVIPTPRGQPGIRSDQTIVLTGPKTATLYPIALRRIHYYSAETDQRLVLLTNNFSIPALTVAALYRYRWQIELFFKWIKQHLRIKRFFGTSDNSVKTQIWIAITVYVLVAIVKKRLDSRRALHCIRS